MKLIELAKELGDVGFARRLRTGAYVRIFPGIAAEAVWWNELTQNGRYLGKCVALAMSRPGVTLTKLSAAVALGAQVKGEPDTVTIAAVPGRTASYSRRKDIKVGVLPKQWKLVKQSVKLCEADKFKKPGTTGRVETHEMFCTSPACTIYDVAATFPLEDSLIAINSLLTAQADKRKTLAEGHMFGEKGKHSHHLNRKAVADILKAKTFASFKTQAGHYRQHGLLYENSAMLLDECLGLVWKNRGKRGVRNALLALLLASDRCESAGESLCCACFYGLGLEQPYLQIDFYDMKTYRTVCRVDGAWDLRSHQKRKRESFTRRIQHGGTAPPGVMQTLLYEFDGKLKYENAAILGGRSKGDVLEQQNRRETGLRAMGYELVRLTWDDLQPPATLMRKLARFGVPKRVRKTAR